MSEERLEERPLEETPDDLEVEDVYDEDETLEGETQPEAGARGSGGLLGMLDAFPGGRKLILGLFAGVMGLSVVGGALYAVFTGGNEQKPLSSPPSVTRRVPSNQFVPSALPPKQKAPFASPAVPRATGRKSGGTGAPGFAPRKSGSSPVAEQRRPVASIPGGSNVLAPESGAKSEASRVATREGSTREKNEGRKLSAISRGSAASGAQFDREGSEAEALLKENPFLSEELKRVLEKAVDRIVSEKLAEEKRRLQEEMRRRYAGAGSEGGRIHVGVNVGTEKEKKGKASGKKEEEAHRYRAPSAVVVRGVIVDAGRIMLVLDDGALVFEGAPYGEGTVMAVDRDGFTVKFPNGKEAKVKAVLALPEAAPKPNTVEVATAVGGASAAAQ